jgi:hypothetical protein
MKKTLLALFGVLIPYAYTLHPANTVVQATKVVDNSGNLLASGQWCVGATCLTVTSGSTSPGATMPNPTIGTLTVTNGGGTTYITIPSVTVSDFVFSWDVAEDYRDRIWSLADRIKRSRPVSSVIVGFHPNSLTARVISRTFS